MLKQVLEQVKSMPTEYRGAPFWSWNGKLEEKELREQINILHEMGLGGFFMHSRVGLATPYLSDEWFDAVRTCIDEAKKLNMFAWAYDEDRWPSGFAGGAVTKNPDYSMRYVMYDELPAGAKVKPDPEGIKTIAYFAVKLTPDNKRIISYRRTDGPAKTLEKGEKSLHFYRKIMIKTSYYNGETYVDTMNPDAMKEFIRVTHEAYKKEISKKDFGTTMPGFFTDEPTYSPGEVILGITWTDKLPEKFKKKFGYDLVDVLPEVFYRTKDEDFSRIRYHFYNLCTELFVTSFSKQIGDWCEKNGAQFTGHLVCEDTALTMTNKIGMPMRFYEYMQSPGIDLLTEHWNIFETAKQCSSVARQFGRRWRLTETYGCTGWDFSFLGHKALGDWQFALGINLRCQHLSYYTMEGQAKRDFPASIFYQSPWYKHYSYVEDYFARLGAALSEGEEQRDLLVIHPVESTFGVADCYTFYVDFVYEPEQFPLIRLRNRLLGANIDYDFGDEEMMSRHASLKKGGKEPVLKLNLADYKSVLVPELRTIRKTTLDLLADFQKAGGLVAYQGEPPAHLDGEKSDVPRQIFKNFVKVNDKNIISVLEPAARRVSIADTKGQEIVPALHLLRKAEKHQTLFICNLGMVPGEIQTEEPWVRDRTLTFDKVKVSLNGVTAKSKVFELDLNSGTLYKVDAKIVNGAAKFDTSLDVCGSRLFFITEENLAASKSAVTDQKSGRKIALKQDALNFKLDEQNVLILDQAQYSVDGGEFSNSRYILEIDETLRTGLLDTEERSGKMVQPWFYEDVKREPKRILDLKVRFIFTATMPRKKIAFWRLNSRNSMTLRLTALKSSRKMKASGATKVCVNSVFRRVS